MSAEYFYMKESQSLVPIPGRYEYQPSRGYKWLQRLCFRVLDRLGCQSYREELTYEQISVNLNSLRDLIFAQRGALERSGHRIHGVIMGPNEFSKLANSEVRADPILFKWPATLHARHAVEYAGMKLYVIPWATGITLLPEL